MIKRVPDGLAAQAVCTDSKAVALQQTLGVLMPDRPLQSSDLTVSRRHRCLQAGLFQQQFPALPLVQLVAGLASNGYA